MYISKEAIVVAVKCCIQWQCSLSYQFVLLLHVRMRFLGSLQVEMHITHGSFTGRRDTQNVPAFWQEVDAYIICECSCL
jgi:hypothetical protein